jgi:hypothetical protein
MLYLHELIDIVGSGQDAYLASVLERASHSEGAGISRLVGTWRVVGSTDRWPRVLNLWEMDGWEHWARSLERQFLPEQRDHALGPWWQRTAEWRSGGFDRILEPTPYSPTVAGLAAAGVRGWAAVHTLVRTAPGRRGEFLARVGTDLQPLLEARGLRLLGAFAVPMRPAEAVFLWASPTFGALCRLYQSRRTDADWHCWRDRVEGLWSEAETCWLVPAEGTRTYPEAGR